MTTFRRSALVALLPLFCICTRVALGIQAANEQLSCAIEAFLWLSLPVSLIWLASQVRQTILRRTLLTISLVAVVPCLPAGCITATEALNASSTGTRFYELISEARSDNMYYRLYRTDCGPTCPFGLSLRQERTLPFGLKLTKLLWEQSLESEGTVVLKSPHTISVVSGGKVLTELYL